MRLLVTADLHYNHPRSRPLAEALIDEMNAAGGDVLLVVGDTGVADGDSIEQCLSRFRFDGPKLLVAGNHELWTQRDDSHAIYARELPERARQLGWRWLEDEPLVLGDVGFVGSIGWYDYTFADPSLRIPRIFYARKVSPAAARMLPEIYADLLDHIPPPGGSADELVARWNDGRFVKLHRSDDQFLQELCQKLESQLDAMQNVRSIVAAIHHVPFAQLLPPVLRRQLAFARAFLGSPKLGEVLQRYENVRRVLCGHSHFEARATIGAVDAINIGSGYRHKRFEAIDL
jgi:Icc-related predicted phosphoesterase